MQWVLGIHSKACRYQFYGVQSVQQEKLDTSEQARGLAALLSFPVVFFFLTIL